MQPYSGIVEVGGKEIRWETTFDQSIKFKCTNCGYCCTSSNVEMSDDEVLEIKGLGKNGFSEDFVTEEGNNSKRIKGSDKDACMFLDGKKLCSVYEHRPSVCRLYPFKLVPVSESLVKIDVTYSCKSILRKHFAKENEVDFGNLVKEFMQHPFLGNKQKYKAQKLHESVREFLDKDMAVTECWNTITGEVKSMEYFEQIWDLLDAFEKSRANFKGILKRSNVKEYISGSISKYKSLKSEIKPYYSPDFFRGSHSRPYQTMDLPTNKVYYFSITGNEVAFRGKEETKVYPISSVAKKQLTDDAKDFLLEYLRTLWERQITMQQIEQIVHETRGTAPSFTIQLQAAKKKFLLFSFFMDAIAHNRGINEITLQDAQEAVFPFDLIFCYMH